MVIDNLPFDKYELEPSPLTQFILSRKQPTVAWQVSVIIYLFIYFCVCVHVQMHSDSKQ